MATLHIEHPITDLTTWLTAFGGFADARRNAGVQAERIQTPVNDAKYIVVDLDFATADQAEAFLAFLRSAVWPVPENAPGLAGEPRTMVLEPVTH